MAIKEKTGLAGVVDGVLDVNKKLFVSDYDLMSVWRSGARGLEKVFMSAPGGAPRGKWSPEATGIMRELNMLLVSRIQHGCQDDYESSRNPGVKPGEDHFAAFRMGTAEHLVNMSVCAQYCARYGLLWPHDPSGRYAGPKLT